MGEIENAVNSDLENLRKWLIANKLSLNVAKTEFILIGSKQMLKRVNDYQLNINIEGKQIKQVFESRTLGVKIDQHLIADEIAANIASKIAVVTNLVTPLS